jgi:hypothetical protein
VDIKLTKDMVAAGKFLQIPVLDHAVMISEQNNFHSLMKGYCSSSHFGSVFGTERWVTIPVRGRLNFSGHSMALDRYRGVL